MQLAGVPKNNRFQWDDPLVLFRPPRGKEKAKHIARSHDITSPGEFETHWRVLAEALAGIRHPALCGRTVRIVGPAVVQNDKWLDVREWVVRIPSQPPDISRVQAVIQRWNGAIHHRRLLTREERDGGRKGDWLCAPIANVRPAKEHALLASISAVLESPEATIGAVARMGPLEKALAGSVAPGYTVHDLRRRRHIASSVMQPLPDQHAPVDAAPATGENQ